MVPLGVLGPLFSWLFGSQVVGHFPRVLSASQTSTRAASSLVSVCRRMLGLYFVAINADCATVFHSLAAILTRIFRVPPLRKFYAARVRSSCCGPRLPKLAP